MNLGSHNPDLSRNHKVLDELTSLVEVTERAAFTANSGDSNADSERDSLASPAPRVLSPEPLTPRVLSPEELAQAEDAFHFDLRSDFDEMYGREEFEEER